MLDLNKHNKTKPEHKQTLVFKTCLYKVRTPRTLSPNQ